MALKLKYEDVLKRINNMQCAICGGGDLSLCVDYKSIEVNGNKATQRCSCAECGAVWYDKYVLIGVDITSDVAEAEPMNPEDLYKNEPVEISGDLSYVDNIPKILQAVLRNKQILPTLLGIDTEFDRLISEALK